MKSTLLLTVAILSVSALSGCSKSSPPEADADLTTAQRIALAQNDIAGFASLSENRLATWDQAHNGSFSAIFGGTQGSDIAAYYNARIHYLVGADEKLKLVDPVETDDVPPQTQNKDPNIQLGALNIGTEFWLLSRYVGLPISVLRADGSTIDMTSSRVGIMEFGPGYSNTIKSDKGKTYPLPPEFRQAILVHEARHSDCTGGLSAEVIASSAKLEFGDFMQKNYSCGHIHSICRAGDYKGIAGCDQEPWGAYMVGAIYMDANTPSDDELSAGDENIYIKYEILKANALDSYSRLQDNPSTAVLAGQSGPPDMSSSN